MAIRQLEEETIDRLGNEPNPRAVMGANEPPLEERIGMEFREALLDGKPEFIIRMEGAIAAVGRAAVTDDETLGKAGDLDKILRACEGRIAETHKEVKQPHLDAGRAVDAEKNRLTAPITEARYTLRDMMNDFMAKREAARRAEEARIAAEQRAAAEAAARAEREAREAEEAASRAMAEANSQEERAEAEARAAAAARQSEQAMAAAAVSAAQAAPNRGPVRSDAGATVSGKTVWNSEVEDHAKAMKAVKSDPKVKAEIEAAVARLVRAGQREIPGVRIWSTIQAVAR